MDPAFVKSHQRQFATKRAKQSELMSGVKMLAMALVFGDVLHSNVVSAVHPMAGDGVGTDSEHRHGSV